MRRVIFSIRPAKRVIVLTLTSLASLSVAGLQARAADSGTAKSLEPDTHFFVPQPADGAFQQTINLLFQSHVTSALQIVEMETTPQAVWLASGTPTQVSATVTSVVNQAKRAKAVPVFVLYNIPGRDCGSYSAGGAQNTADYEDWIDAVASALGNQKAVLVVEPDAIANLPSDCGYDPTKVNISQATADRYTQLNYAVTRLAQQSQVLVYLDGGNSAWQAVGTIAARLVMAGVKNAQGFFSNVSNYRYAAYEAKFDTWVSECVAFANNSADGGWRLGHYDYCASQYYSPNGTVDPNNIATWGYTDDWYAQNLGSAKPTMRFIMDTSRNGQGPLSAAQYGSAPYNQPASVVQTVQNGSWCNPPGRGLGYRPTANTGFPLLDAVLWIKTPGQSDGTCDAAGGARAWDYTAYKLPSWPADAAGQAVFDPLWGLADPAAGAWFPQQALDLAQRANPPLKPW